MRKIRISVSPSSIGRSNTDQASNEIHSMKSSFNMCPNGSGLDLYFPLLSPSFSASASDPEDEGNPERVEFPATQLPARAFSRRHFL